MTDLFIICVLEKLFMFQKLDMCIDLTKDYASLAGCVSVLQLVSCQREMHSLRCIWVFFFELQSDISIKPLSFSFSFYLLFQHSQIEIPVCSLFPKQRDKKYQAEKQQLLLRRQPSRVLHVHLCKTYNPINKYKKPSDHSIMGIQSREVPCSGNCSCGKNANSVK